MDSYRENHSATGTAYASDPFLGALFRPSAAYETPSEVLQDDDLTLYEKKAILASWASDVWAMDSTPALRAPSELARPATIDEIMQCLKALDDEIQKRCILWERSREAKEG